MYDKILKMYFLIGHYRSNSKHETLEELDCTSTKL